MFLNLTNLVSFTIKGIPYTNFSLNINEENY